MTRAPSYIDEFTKRYLHLLTELKSAATGELYDKIIAHGKALPSFDRALGLENERVKGCQSIMYLKIELIDNKLHLQIHSDALISKGLAALVIELYEGLPLEAPLKCNCTLAQDLHLETTLSPSRVGGFGALIEHLQRQCLKMIMLR